MHVNQSTVRQVTEWCGAGMAGVRCRYLHMVQLMSLSPHRLLFH